MTNGAVPSAPATGPMCHAPFVSMEFDPFGDVQVCCANVFHPLGNVGRSSLEEIWRGSRAVALRAAVADGDLTLGCTICRHRIEHDEAERIYEMYDTFPITDVSAPWPTRLAFSLHNTCNLECRMCGADRSSRIRLRRDRLPALPHVYGDDFFEQLVPFVARAELFDFSGGEPFLVREHFRVWDILEEHRPGAQIAVTTNGTIWNDRVERVLDRFHTGIRFSIDGVTAETFESIRVGADYAEVMSNLERFRAHATARRTWLGFSWSFMQQNWFELGRMVLWAESMGLPVTVQTVVDPGFGVQRLDDDALGAVHDAMSRESDQIVDRLTINRDVWLRQIHMIREELDRRASGRRPNELYMEPARADGADHVAERIMATASSQPVGMGDIDARDHLARWVDDSPPVRILLDASGCIVDGDLAALLGPGHQPETAPRDDRVRLTDLIELITTMLGEAMWIIDALVQPTFTVHTLLIGRLKRDKQGVVVRLASHRTDGGVELLITRDDRFALSATSVWVRT